MLIADLSDILGGAERLTTREARARAALTIQRELTRAVGRMWALYEAHDELNAEQPDGAPEAFAASLDEWWHACIGAEQAWSAAAGAPYRPAAEVQRRPIRLKIRDRLGYESYVYQTAPGGDWRCASRSGTPLALSNFTRDEPMTRFRLAEAKTAEQARNVLAASVYSHLSVELVEV